MSDDGANSTNDTDDHVDERRTDSTPIAIQLTDIVKRFPGVVANDGVNLTVRAGSVHAIVGENGAGKSTLMKTLYGAHKPDEGTITVNGKDEVFSSPKDAIADGIGMVFQHFMLADNLTVWENIVLGQEPGTAVSLDIRSARLAGSPSWASSTVSRSTPTPLVSELGVGDKQRVEILKVLYRGAKILILDEPTAVLVPQEVDELFTSLRELTAEGATIIFISHKLDEVLKHADAITVIRQGKTVAEIADPSSRHVARPRRADGRQRTPDAGDPRAHGHRRRRARAPRAHGRQPRGRSAQRRRRRELHGAPRRDRRHRRRGGQRPERTRQGHRRARGVVGHDPRRRRRHRPAVDHANGATAASATSPRTARRTAS